MGTTGLIYAAIAIAWLAYLVPLYVKKRHAEPAEEADPANRFSDSMRIIKSGTAPLLDQDLAEMGSVEVSTPLTRRAALDDLRRLEKVAARRRRRMLVLLFAASTAVVGACAAGLVPWWYAAVPGGLLAGFLVLARISVRGMRRRLDARYLEIAQGGEESTVFLSRRELVKIDTLPAEKPEPKKPAERTGVLWDPVPITLPTYVSKPLAPRTVRTIDLSGPGVTSSGRSNVPVTADAQPDTTVALQRSASTTNKAESEVVHERPRAVGE